MICFCWAHDEGGDDDDKWMRDRDRANNSKRRYPFCEIDTFLVLFSHKFLLFLSVASFFLAQNIVHDDVRDDLSRNGRKKTEKARKEGSRKGGATAEKFVVVVAEEAAGNKRKC